MTRAAIVLLLLAAPLAGRELVAQEEDSTLTIARRLATAGQGDSARALVRGKLRRTAPSDSAFPAVLFTAGVIASDLDSARTFFRRVSIEYSNSPWADDALLRLAQLAFAANDFAGAARTARRILLDFPFSDRHPEAGYWAARAELELGELAQACVHLAVVAEDTTASVELLNQVGYYRQRCVAAPAVTGRDTTVLADTARTGPTTFAVQVAAVSSVGAADEIMRALHAQGHGPHVVRDRDGLWKVRVGRFADRAQAERLAAELKEQIGGQPFVVEEQ